MFGLVVGAAGGANAVRLLFTARRDEIYHLLCRRGRVTEIRERERERERERPTASAREEESRKARKNAEERERERERERKRESNWVGHSARGR